MCCVQSLGGINIFILVSTTAFVYCAPLAYFMESHKWSATFEAARASVGNQRLMFLMGLSAILYTVMALPPCAISGATPARICCMQRAAREVNAGLPSLCGTSC